MNKFIAGSIVSIGLTAATVALSAQTVTPPGAGGQTMQHGERHHGKRAFSMPGERVEARLAYMKTALKITDAQQAQWNAFADVARKQAAARDKRIQEFRSRMAQGDAKDERPNAIARLERQQQRRASTSAWRLRSRFTRRCHPSRKQLRTKCWPRADIIMALVIAATARSANQR
jgi:hypothetical protein